MSEHFGKYLLQRKLAEGGMAEVFLARQSGMEGFEKPVVIKRILPHLSGEQQFIDMFLNEAKVAARLSHPAIVQIFDFGRESDQYFIAMEFIHGEDLRNLAKAAEKEKIRPPFALTCRIFADMLGGLHYAHTRVGPDGKKLGLVHRDVSPQNVLVTYEGGVKLVDFGIAKATESQGVQQTQAGLLKGKYAYMSPEQCRGLPLDARSDVFAVGILLWELITWKRLFRRDSDLATLVAVADEDIPPPRSVREDIPVELDRICMKALARPLEQRYASAQAMQSDLESLIRNSGWEADSITLQRFMRELFAEKLHLQDDAMRAAGVGSIEDFLVRVEDGTQMAWIDRSAPGGSNGSGAGAGSSPAAVVTTSLPAAVSHFDAGPLIESTARPDDNFRPRAPMLVAMPEPSGRVAMATRAPIAPMAPARSAPAFVPPASPWWADQRAPEFTGSTLRHAVGQSVARPASSSASHPVTLPPSGWKRLAVVAATATVVGTAVLAAMFWPFGATQSSTGIVSAAGGAAVIAEAPQYSKVRVILDVPAVVLVDGEAQAPGKDVEVQVSARAEHELRVHVTGQPDRPATKIPPLSPGEVKTVRLRVGG